MDGPGIEFRWGGRAKFSAPVQTGPGVRPASYTPDKLRKVYQIGVDYLTYHDAQSTNHQPHSPLFLRLYFCWRVL
jgi:hypothetical protein